MEEEAGIRVTQLPGEGREDARATRSSWSDMGGFPWGLQKELAPQMPSPHAWHPELSEDKCPLT